MSIRALLLGATSVALLSSTSAFAADLIIPTTPQPIYESAGFSWDGFYAGAQAGGQFFPAATLGIVGVHAGVNFTVADPLVLGLEATAEYIGGAAIPIGVFFANARVGAALTDHVLVYGIAGTGFELDSTGTFPTYQLGGGVELAVSDAVSVRGQLTGIGFWGNANLFSATKATVGISYHF